VMVVMTLVQMAVSVEPLTLAAILKEEGMVEMVEMVKMVETWAVMMVVMTLVQMAVSVEPLTLAATLK
jgi:hypothetical protein